jgi:myo-inositol-1(or 4)-monophosphatase
VDLPDLDLAQERDALAASVRAAGALALEKFQQPLKSWLKEGSSPVCEADIAVDALLRERLGARGSFGWRSEESKDVRLVPPAKFVWIVDPIDGTRSYLAGRPDWVISVALVAENRPLVAALFAPVTDELFLAVRGAGATRNGAPIRTSPGSGVEAARIAGPKRFVEALAAVAPRSTAMPRLGSLALRLARLAQGEADIVFASGSSHDWDLAAADLLVHEAGGAMTSLAGRSVIYNQPAPVHGPLVAAGAERHAALVALTRNWAAELQ